MTPAKKQPGTSLRRAIKVRMLGRQEMTVRALAKKIGRPESTVSKAINHGRFPLVRAQIMEALGV